MDPGPAVRDAAGATTVTVHTSADALDGVNTAGTEHFSVSSNSNDNQVDWRAMIAATTTQTTVTGETELGVQTGDWMSLIRGARFFGNGKYITGYVDASEDLAKVLEDYQSMTNTQFPSVHQLSISSKTSEDEYLQQRFLTPSARPRLFWQMHAGEPVIPFDGVPFVSVGQGTEVPCVLAGRRKTTTQVLVATGDVLPTKVRTHGCAAKISIRRILRYPSGRLPDTGVQGITAMRKLRKRVLEVLTAKICAGLVKPMERFYFSMPTPLGHDTHVVAEMEDPPSLIEPVHEEILKQIGQGVTIVSLIQEHVQKFVENSYGDDPTIDIQDPTFSPSRYDLTRYVYWLYKSGRASDRENPFRERYSLVKEDAVNMTDKCKSPSIVMAVSKASETQSSQEETLANIYNIVMADGGDIANLEISTPQVGAEETTTTISPSSLAVASSSGASSIMSKPEVHHHQQPMNGNDRLVATPHSNVFNVTASGGKQPSDSGLVQQTQTEVRSMLQIIENQTYACQDLSALQTLRRQLTSLCTEFSMHLAGLPKKRPVDLSVSENPKRQRIE